MPKRTESQVIRIFYISLLAILAIWLASPFFIPLVLAASIALALYPMQERLLSRGWKNTRAALLLTTFFTFVISIPFIVFCAKGTIVLMNYLKKFQLSEISFSKIKSSAFSNILSWVEGNTPFGNTINAEQLDNYLKSSSKWGVDFLQGMLTSIPDLGLAFFVMIICVFSFLHYGPSIRNFFQYIFGFNAPRMKLLTTILIRDSRQVYVSNVATGLIQSFIIATAVYFVSNADWFLIFFVTLIISFIPVIGAAPVGVAFAIVSFIQGNVTGGIILLVVSAFTGVIDNILRPFLSSLGDTKAPQMVSFICLLGGAILLGFPGLFLGLLVAALVYDTFPLFWDGVTKSDTVFSGLFALGSEKLKNSDDEMTKH